jgi:hypothetical protein
MSINYPLTMPNIKSFKSIRLYSINAVAVARSPYTHVTQVQQFAGQSWGADVTFPEMSREEAEAFNAFLLALMGQNGTFYLGDPLGQIARGSAGGTPLVKGANQTGNEVLTDGWTVSATGILLAGDYIQIGTGLYKILEDVTSDGSGNATLKIFPRLATSPADNQSVIKDSCVGIFRLTENITPIYDLGIEKLYSIGFSCVEAK